MFTYDEHSFCGAVLTNWVEMAKKLLDNLIVVYTIKWNFSATFSSNTVTAYAVKLYIIMISDHIEKLRNWQIMPICYLA